MATSNVKFYKINFPSDTNCLIDNMESFLSSGNGGTALEYANFQYIKPELNLSIKIAIDQIEVNDFNYNYCKIVNSDNANIFYFNIVKTNWIAPNVVKIDLKLDTVNTLGRSSTDYCNPRQFTNKTKILRQHEDRFFKETNITYPINLKRKVNMIAEDISPVNWIKTTDEILYDPQVENAGELNRKENYYLLYATKTVGQSQKMTVSVIDDEGILLNVNTERTNNPGIYTNGIKDGTNSVAWSANNGLIYIHNATEQSNCQIKVYNKLYKYWMELSPGMEVFTLEGFLVPTTYVVDDIIVNGYSSLTSLYTYPKYSILLRCHKKILGGTYIIPLIQDTKLQASKTADGYPRYWSGNLWFRPGWIQISDDNPLLINPIPTNYYIYSSAYNNLIDTNHVTEQPYYTMIVQGTGGPTFMERLQDVDLTNDKIVKIVACPYCPIKMQWTENGMTVIDNDWQYVTEAADVDYHSLRFTGTGTPKLNREVAAVVDISDNILYTVEEPAYTDLKDSKMESKLKNSQFKMCSVNYDNFSSLIKPERFYNIYTEDGKLPIDFKMSNGLSSNFACSLNYETIGRYYEEENYDGLLLANRNNEIPLFTSAYNEYVRNGYNYDVKSNELKNKQASQDIVINTLKLGATAAIVGSAAGPAGTIGGAAIGATTALINLNNQVDAQKLAITTKLALLSNQGLSVSGSSDFDLLNYYNQNRLHYVEYEPEKNFKQSIYNYLNLYGYANGTINTPDVDSRIWYNFIQCEPELYYEGTRMLNEAWLEDLKSKYKEGVTVFHRNEITEGQFRWRLDRSFENYESWLFN